MYDLLIKGGKVVDGSGAPWFRADVAVAGDRIAAVGNLDGAKAVQVVEAGGQCVSPGFIDIHSHSDTTILVNPRAESKIRQGVTTEVIGQCGSSAAPIAARSVEFARGMAKEYGIEITWDTMAGYVREVTRRGVAVNIVPVVGHNAIRTAVMGYERRVPSPEELAAMCDLVAQACADGARAFSSGLIYPPSAYADSDELAALCAAAARYGAIYMTHMRNEGDGLLDSIRETVDVARRAGIPVQISHHKAVGRDNWGKVRESLAMLEEARRGGVDVTCDQYPYVASSTGLSSVIPQWAHEGGPARLLQRLRDPEDGLRIRREMEQAAIKRGGWDEVLIAGTALPELKQWEGKTVEQIGQARRTDPITAVFDLLLAGKYVGMIRFGMSEEDVKTVMRHPLVMVGSDGSCLADYGPLSAGKPHPRNYGTFVRVLGKYVREEGNLSLEEAVRKMTSLPAARIKLADRGLLRPGLAADITVFDPDTVAERATFVEPHQYAGGISLVVVNGRVAVSSGEHTGQLAGRVLVRRDS
ncbi:MAG: D-aminoacylase [Bacillota bacterium]|nr:D-aminoacylase [Bacillota bacterium]